MVNLAGRFDQYLWPFYQRDLAEGQLTRAEAAELLACLWIKFNEVRICAVDIINYQNLMIGGVDRDGRDATNELSYLCLEDNRAPARVSAAQPFPALAPRDARQADAQGERFDPERLWPAGDVQ